MINWEPIREAYITGGLSYRQLAALYGISYGQLARHAGEENWPALRAGQQETPDAVLQLSQQLLEKMADMVQALPTTGYSNLRYLSGALKDIRDLQRNKEDTATAVAVSLSSEVREYAD